jgi:hypothetical protein
MSSTATVSTFAAPQHLVALAHANKVRLARAELKKRIAYGQQPAAEVFLECPWEAASMTVADVLMSQRRWGSARCRKVLTALHISETRTVGSLTMRQRKELATRLAETPDRALAFA